MVRVALHRGVVAPCPGEGGLVRVRSAMTRLPISVCMISGAESRRIGRALESVAEWAGEIIVVLNEDVRDGTEEIARQHGARAACCGPDTNRRAESSVRNTSSTGES